MLQLTNGLCYSYISGDRGFYCPLLPVLAPPSSIFFITFVTSSIADLMTLEGIFVDKGPASSGRKEITLSFLFIRVEIFTKNPNP